MAPSQLAPESPHEQLVAYLATHHSKLVPYLPEDTECVDLFGALRRTPPKPIAGAARRASTSSIRGRSSTQSSKTRRSR
jgi:hypothetical protein